MRIPALQDVIHRIEVGEWTRYVKVGVALLGFVAFTVVYDLRQYKNFATQEAMDSAQLARNIAKGKGFTTDFVRPLSLYLLERHNPETKRSNPGAWLKSPHPDLANPPVYPLLEAGLMKVLPFRYEIPAGVTFGRYQPEVLVAIMNQLFFFAAVLLVFWLALKLFDGPVAWLSALLFAGTDLFWKFTVSGLSTLLLVLLFLLLVWCLVLIEEKSRQTPPPGNSYFILLAAVAGLLIGVGALTRYSFVWLVVPVVLFFVIFLGQRRAVLSLVAVAASAVVVTPWLVRNNNLAGTPLGTATYAVYQVDNLPVELRGSKLERYMSSEFDLALAKVGVNQFLRKLMVNSAEIVRYHLVNLGGNWVSAFFLVGLLVPFLNPGLNRLRVFLLLSLLVLIIAQAMGKGHLSDESPEINTENLIIIVAPLAFMFGVAMFSLLLDQIDLPFPPTRVLVTGTFGVLMCLPLVFAILPPRSFPIAYPPYWPPMVQDIAGWMEPEELMMSDMPWAVAWYGNRKCLWATLDAPSDLSHNCADCGAEFRAGQLRDVKTCPKCGGQLKRGSTKAGDFFRINDNQKAIQGILLTRVTTDAKWFSQMIQGQDYAWGKFMLECLLRTNVPTGFPLKYSPPGFLQNGLLFLSDWDRWSPRESKRQKHQVPLRE